MTVTCAKYEPLVPKRNPPPLSLCWRQKGNQSGPCDPGCTDTSEHCVPVYWATDCKSFTFKGRKKKRPWLFISLLKRKTWITKFEITRLLYFTSANIKFFQVFGYTDLKQEHKKPDCQSLPAMSYSLAHQKNYWKFGDPRIYQTRHHILISYFSFCRQHDPIMRSSKT